MDDYENDEMQEGDLVTEDFCEFREVGSSSRKPVVVVGADDDNWQAAVKAYMDAQMYWPNVWRVSDHGNIELVTI